MLKVLPALTNDVVLLLPTVYIFYEAYQRFIPPEIQGGPMLRLPLSGSASTRSARSFAPPDRLKASTRTGESGGP